MHLTSFWDLHPDTLIIKCVPVRIERTQMVAVSCTAGTAASLASIHGSVLLVPEDHGVTEETGP